MKRFYDWIVVVFTVIFCFSFVLGCGGGGGDVQPEGYEQKVTISSLDGKHIFSISEDAFPPNIPAGSKVFLAGTFTRNPIELGIVEDPNGDVEGFSSVPLSIRRNQKFSFYKEKGGNKYFPSGFSPAEEWYWSETEKSFLGDFGANDVVGIDEYKPSQLAVCIPGTNVIEVDMGYAYNPISIHLCKLQLKGDIVGGWTKFSEIDFDPIKLIASFDSSKFESYSIGDSFNIKMVHLKKRDYLDLNALFGEFGFSAIHWEDEPGFKAYMQTSRIKSGNLSLAGAEIYVDTSVEEEVVIASDDNNDYGSDTYVEDDYWGEDPYLDPNANSFSPALDNDLILDPNNGIIEDENNDDISNDTIIDPNSGIVEDENDDDISNDGEVDPNSVIEEEEFDIASDAEVDVEVIDGIFYYGDGVYGDDFVRFQQNSNGLPEWKIFVKQIIPVDKQGDNFWVGGTWEYPHWWAYGVSLYPSQMYDGWLESEFLDISGVNRLTFITYNLKKEYAPSSVWLDGDCLFVYIGEDTEGKVVISLAVELIAGETPSPVAWHTIGF